MKTRSFFSILLGSLLLSLLWLPKANAESSISTHVTIFQDMPFAYVGCGGANAPVSNADYEQQVVDLVNTERANASLPPLKRMSSLDQAARYHATDLAQDNYFEHDSYDRSGGNLVYVCAWSARLAAFYAGASAAGENIAAGYGTPQDVMTGWMGSSGHRANILSASYREIGVGYFQGGAWGAYWVQDFGRRSSNYPLIINRDAATTDTRTVTIYIYGSWQEMRLRNDNGTWGSWQPFQTSFAWTLANGKGDHTVTAEVRSGGTTVTTSDSIYLTTGPTLGNISSALLFVYSQPEQAMLLPTQVVVPLDTGGGASLDWSLTTEGTWFSVAPTTGTSPSSFTITPTTFAKGTVATYTGAITVTATNPADAANSPQRINLTLQVTSATFPRFNFPLVKK